MKKIWLLSWALLGVLLVGCSGSKEAVSEEQDNRPEVVATSTMVADMVKTIAGEYIKVTGLIPAGVDPHSFEPHAGVLSDIKNADLIIYNGMHLEGKMTDTFENNTDKTLAIISLLPKDRLITAEQIDEDYGDPHVWGDVELWSLAVPGVVNGLSKLLPEKKADFEARGKAYQEQLLELNKWAKDRVNEIPKQSRYLITSHDAFNYFGKAYDIRVVGVKGISTVDEASGADLLNTKDLIKEKSVKAIFPESSTASAEIKRIASDAGVKIGETLYSDSCGPAGKMVTRGGETYDVGTYIGMIKHNINAIVDALK